MKICYALALLAPTAVFAAGPIDGTWAVDTTSIKSATKPEVFKLKDGTYTCSSCTPSYSIKADGTDQPIKGHAYADTLAVTVVDAQNVTMVAKKDGKPTFTSTMTVSADGKTLTDSFKSTVGTEATTGTETLTRKGSAPKGEHAISGKWNDASAPSNLQGGALTVVFTSSADDLKMSSNGQSYDAKFDGKQVPIEGDPGKTMVTVKHVSDRHYVETDYRMGKKVETLDVTVSDDGKTAKAVDKNLINGAVTTYTMTKQS